MTDCQLKGCAGITTGLRCTDHGQLCSECKMPTAGTRPDGKCVLCGARADGVKCGGCGSPWVVLRYHEDRKWRCRPCVSAIIAENGWHDDFAEISEGMKTTDERLRSEAVENAAKQEKLAEQVKKATARKTKPKQEEGLFVLEDPKKKKRKGS